MTGNWVQLVIGTWILLSPWLLGFSAISVMLWSNLLAGIIIILINLWEIFGDKQSERPLPAGR